MLFIHEMYVCEYYENLIEYIKEIIANDETEDLDLINCIDDMIHEETLKHFLCGVANIVDKISLKYSITEDILNCTFDIYFKYMFDVDIILTKSKGMSYTQFLILEECGWLLKSSDSTTCSWRESK